MKPIISKTNVNSSNISEPLNDYNISSCDKFEINGNLLNNNLNQKNNSIQEISINLRKDKRNGSLNQQNSEKNELESKVSYYFIILIGYIILFNFFKLSYFYVLNHLFLLIF
jgi:hypothetical protein